MKLSKKQRLFTKCIGKLIKHAYANGYELTFGDAYRDPRVFGKTGVKKGYGRSKSVHKIRLAVDFNLFINGVYQVSSDAHKPLGLYWESLDDRCAWGGWFNDGNHYSFKHNGRR